LGIEDCGIRRLEVDELAVGLSATIGRLTELRVVGVFVHQEILGPVRIAWVARPPILFKLGDEPCTQRVAFDVPAGLQEVAILGYQGALLAPLPDVAGVPDLVLIPSPVALEDELHELWQVTAGGDLQQEVDVV
jgi:hypothetical protein